MSEKPLWTHLSTLPETFEEVFILDLDPSKTSWSRIHEDLRVVYLKLNRDPPDLLWTKFFHEERESRTMIRRRGLWIEEGYISFDCLPEEIEPYHLPDIQRSLDFANRNYREYYDMRRREMRASDPVAAARGTLETMRSRLFRPQDQPTGEVAKPADVQAPPIYDAGRPTAAESMLSDAELAAHDAALGFVPEAPAPKPDAGGHAIVKRADQYRADVTPAPKPAPAAKPAPVASNSEVTDQSLEKTLAEYRAKVRAAFDAQKKKT